MRIGYEDLVRASGQHKSEALMREVACLEHVETHAAVILHRHRPGARRVRRLLRRARVR